MRVPILLLSAVACVCFAALAVIYLMPAPEATEPPLVEERTRSYIEDSEPDDEVVAVAEEVKPVRTRARPKRKRTPAPPPKPKTGSLSVKIESSSDRVTNINLTCGSYFKKQNVNNGVAKFSNVPTSSCKLKFNPGGAIYTGQVTGKKLSCSVSNGNNVRCSK